MAMINRYLALANGEIAVTLDIFEQNTLVISTDIKNKFEITGNDNIRALKMALDHVLKEL